MTKPDWKGVYSALLTPFNIDDSIDFELFVKNLDAQLDAGIHGAVIGGSLGEASTLSNDEKFQLLKAAKSDMKRPVPVILNIAEQTTRDAVALALRAAKEGADGLMLLPPMRYKADDRETLRYFTAIAQTTDLPIMIYNNPVDYKIEVTLEMFRELANIPTIQAVKESTRDAGNVTRMKNNFGDRFSILCGVDTIAFEALALGADGWVAGLVDAFPRETVNIFNLVKSGRHEEALLINRWFLPVLELDIHPKLVQYIKLAATATGIGSEYVREPRLIIEGIERQQVLSIIQAALSTRPAQGSKTKHERTGTMTSETL